MVGGNWQSDLEADFLQGGLVRPTFPPGGHLLEHHIPTSLVFPFLFFLARLLLQQEEILQNNALCTVCSKSNGRCDIKAEKREELESKSSHKSDILLPAAYKK